MNASPSEKNKLGASLLRGVMFLLVLAALSAVYFLFLLELRPRDHKWDFLEMGLFGNVFQAATNFTWAKISPKEEDDGRDKLQSLVGSLISLFLLYAFRDFKNGSPFIDAEGFWESLGLMSLFIFLGIHGAHWMLPKKDKMKG